VGGVGRLETEAVLFFFTQLGWNEGDDYGGQHEEAN
jgi:hypothetical protein